MGPYISDAMDDGDMGVTRDAIAQALLGGVYTEHLKGRKVLLETPTGFAVFLVKDFAFEQDKNIWVHFSDPECAILALVALGFKKVDNRSVAQNSDAGPGKDLVQLIMKFCRTGETLIVQDKELKASMEKKIGITCRCDGSDVGEVIWGIKNVLHAFIREEERNITPEYCLPGFPKELSRSFDECVGIGDTIKDGLDYVKVLAMVLVPELVKERDFSKTFSSDLASKLHQAQLFQAKCEDDLTMHELEKIMGYLDYLLEPVDFNKMEFRRVLLETPSGFAIFNVCEDVFSYPEIVFAIGFVSVDEKSVTRNSDLALVTN
ncbi:unnamed protein product [Miscanthus lutarioriparius]|uniref:Uncharacterized protein n=1 Tax=Miscanthus lutarioriparius TaxID=422564 RepID=A0A811NVF1_9POAL|nr:unnamed protein product [Miscanthus lutarioriparius]